MQFDDPRSVLDSAAAKPSRGIDPYRLARRGRRLRRARYGAAAAGLGLAIAVTSASLGLLGSTRNQGPGPTGTDACSGPDTTVSFFLRHDATDAEVQALRTELEQDPDVVEVEYTSAASAPEALGEVTAESGSSVALAPAPAYLRVVAVDEAAARRLEDLDGPALDVVAPRPVRGDFQCLVQTYCATEMPLTALIFLDDGTPRRAALALRDELLSARGVKSVDYVSKHEAYDEFVRLYEDRLDLYATISPGDLPARLNVTAADEAALDRVRALQSPAVDEIKSSGDLHERYCGERSEAQPLPSPTADEDGRGESRYDPRTPLDVDLLRAECRTPRTLSAMEGRELPAAVKSCRFVVFVDNASWLSLEPDLDEQVLWTTNGHLLHPSPEVNEGELARRLFDDPIGPDEHRIGEVAFLLSPGEVPAALEVRLDPSVAPTRFRLDYDCAADLRRDPRGRCLFTPDQAPDGAQQASGRVEVTLYHCGVEPVVVAGREWVVPSPPFDATNAPADFFGEGRFEIKSDKYAVYVDRSGEVIRFRAIPDWAPPPCD